jgi:hypothetical protein
MPVAVLERPLPPPQRGVVRAARAAHDLLPLTRRGDDPRAVLPRRSASQLDPTASATAFLLTQALGRLDPAERRRILDRGSARRGQLDAPLVVDEGCDVQIGRRRVGEEARVALLAWLPPAAAEVALFEGGLLRDRPADAVALLLRPPLIWSLHEALRAGASTAPRAGFDPGWFSALERGAHGRVRPCHLHRVRRAAERIEARLPVEGLPTASATVAAGCAAVADDDAVSREIAARQLARYALSEVARRSGRG